ncbi:class I adenylate-forming enzyme family protein [Sphingorhabdus arenilitoris]|uniref:Class I adenylate-forming enzyme family protein n=1 Tax=Sphingorhabdus arenilitoris TaxID=1490041 RepID=A0ABV8RIQ5_9SPHN
MTTNPIEYLEEPYGDFSALIAAHGEQRESQIALDDGDEKLTWGQVDALTARIAAQLQADGLQKGQAVAILGTTTVHYALAYLAAIRAGGCAAPLTTSAAPQQLEAMMADSGAVHLFIDAAKLADMAGRTIAPKHIIMLDGAQGDHPDYRCWMAAQGAAPADPDCTADDPFNIIYSSGTTGTPKGIVHSRQMRWRQYAGQPHFGVAGQATMLSTPLYSNTTLGLFLPTMAYGGTALLMKKFDVKGWLQRAAAARATHTMLVPVQYKRLMEYPQFDDYDLSAMQLKYCTSAPFSAELKAEVLERMPGGLVEIYSMTEGGVVCLLLAHEHPDKLHTVGVPWGGSEVFTIDEEGRRLPDGEIGELVGRSRTMMNGYQNQPEKTRDASWFDADGSRWQRMGDIGRVDADGFIELLGRSKDMIISGGFNIYPVDLENVLMEHPDVAEAAVIGVESDRWGETPLGFVVAQKGAALDTDEVLAATNAKLGKTQRLSALHVIEEMPRSHIGKLLKTELREMALNKVT